MRELIAKRHVEKASFGNPGSRLSWGSWPVKWGSGAVLLCVWQGCVIAMCSGSEISAADEAGDAFCPKSAFSTRELLAFILVRAVGIGPAVRTIGSFESVDDNEVLSLQS
jgi:hypothetical protein